MVGAVGPEGTALDVTTPFEIMTLINEDVLNRPPTKDVLAIAVGHIDLATCDIDPIE